MEKIATKEQISLLLTQLLTNDKEINDKLEAKIAEAIASITIPEPTSAKSRWYNKKWYAVAHHHKLQAYHPSASHSLRWHYPHQVPGLGAKPTLSLLPQAPMTHILPSFHGKFN